MEIKSPADSTIKNKIKLTRNHFNKIPLNNRKRRKSSIPLQLRQLISNNSLNKIMPKLSCKNNFTGEISNKNEPLNDIINTNIPEVSENSSNIKEGKITKIKKRKKANNNENNNYFIHYINNIYENESHLNKENIINRAKKNIRDSFLKLVESNKTFHYPVARRRNSALNTNFSKSNFHNIKLYLDKEHLNKKEPLSILNKKQSANIGNLLHKKNLDGKEKEKVKKFFNKNKNKTKDNRHKDKDFEKGTKTPEKNLSKEKTIRNSDKTIHKKKIKEKEKELLPNENEIKIISENNTESTKTKKKSKIKKFLCCFINDNCDSSFENN